MKTIVEPLHRRSSAHSTIDSTGQAFIHSEAFVHSEAKRPSTPMLDPSVGCQILAMTVSGWAWAEPTVFLPHLICDWMLLKLWLSFSFFFFSYSL
jgi:hypothetical protein